MWLQADRLAFKAALSIFYGKACNFKNNETKAHDV